MRVRYGPFVPWKSEEQGKRQNHLSCSGELSLLLSPWQLKEVEVHHGMSNVGYSYSL